MKKSLFISLFLLALTSFKIFAQTDTPRVDSTYVRMFNMDFNNLTLGKLYDLDTISITASSYDPTDKPLVFLQTLTNSGSAHQTMGLKKRNSIGFSTDVEAFSSYIKAENDVSFPITYQPFTQLHYMMGTNKEQHLNVVFSREFFPRFVMTLNYNIDFVPALYKNDRAKNTYFTANARYNTADERYGVMGFFFHNKLNVQENAGILNDSLFENNIETDRAIMDVNLTTAKNLIRVMGFGLRQYINLSGDDDGKDPILGIGRLNHDFLFKRNSYTYTDSDPLADFYKRLDPVLDSTSTYDSVAFYIIKNNLHWNNLGYDKYDNDIPLYIDAGVSHEITFFDGFNNPLTDERMYKKTYRDIKMFALVETNLFNSLRLTGRAEAIIVGDKQGDFILDINLFQHLGTKKRNIGAMRFSADLSQISPDVLTEKFFSNNLRWEFQFDRTRILELKGEYTLNDETNLKGLTFGYKHSIVKNYIYFDQTARPKQFVGTFNISSLYANAHLHIHNFEMTGTAAFLACDNHSIVHIPSFYAKAKIGYLIPLVKNISYLQPCVTIYYFTNYYADAYMPVTRTFYLQDDVSIGDYPLMDFYVTFKIKRADVFVGYTNLYSFSQDFSYFNSPHYPARDRRFVFGVRWRLYK